MNTDKDYYAILGILPGAEDVVIRAAYKALAQRYHPDRFDGDREEGYQRMAEINEAYQVLSDSASHDEYDKARGSNTQSSESYFNGGVNDVPPAFDPLTRDWCVAVKYYPDLVDIEARLAKISWRLAYSFRAYLLDVKLFDQRAQIAESIEHQFLETYFGSDPKILRFAHELISQGYKAAAKSLNDTVRVLGSRIDSTHIIERIRYEYSVEKPIAVDSFLEVARRFRALGMDESAIQEHLISRGLRPCEAEILAGIASHGE